VRERPLDRDEEEGLSDEELAGEEATELPARQAMSSIGDVSIPLDPHEAADALLGQDDGATDGAD
jgi:hypothetical protein